MSNSNPLAHLGLTDDSPVVIHYLSFLKELKRPDKKAEQIEQPEEETKQPQEKPSKK